MQQEAGQLSCNQTLLIACLSGLIVRLSGEGRNPGSRHARDARQAAIKLRIEERN
jgi:hypothetical protein